MKPRHLIVPFTLVVGAWQAMQGLAGDPGWRGDSNNPRHRLPDLPCLVAVDYGMIMNNCPLPVEFVIPLTVIITGAPFNNWEVDFRAATSTWCKLNLASNDGTGTGTPANWARARARSSR